MQKTSLIWGKILFILTLLIIACKKDPIQLEPLAEEEIMEIIDPFYSVLTEDSSLQDYWEVFAADAIRSGKLDPGIGRNISLFFGEEPDFSSGVTSDHAGRAYNICDEGTVSFEIIKSFWEDFSIVQRLYTFYHEAGHARYKYRHPCESYECTSNPEDFPIMWLSVLPGNTPLDEFIRDKKNFFKQKWDGIRYFNCSD
ncbi:MAG: hypothetical protein ACI9TK_000066 [Flavobacteriaceae bacterium]|jgi:hypothetical protein|tara:strand:- start:17814 stop:18407 length:594 start_codon:yes stop_codon:yes gene_type:complete